MPRWSFFADLRLRLWRRWPCARVRRLPKDLRIFSQGDDGVRAHAVIEGGVRIAQSGSDGAQVIVRFIGPGEMFGTVALFTDGRYPADAITWLKRWRRAGARRSYLS